MQTPQFFPADAHEGPVWEPTTRRLYYTTNTHLDGRRRVDIEFLDFAHAPDLSSVDPAKIAGQCWRKDANMANGMRLAHAGEHLLVAEQGYEDRSPGAITRIALADGHRDILVDHFGDKPFNSPNKVIESRAGHLIFSDPDYGFRQSFKPPSVLEPNLYVRTAAGALDCFRCRLEMPHGLALSPSEDTLFVTDTSNDGAHGDDIKLQRRRSVWKFTFDPGDGSISGEGKYCFSVKEGVPDGMLTTEDRLLVGGGDGVYVANLRGELLGIIPTEHTAVNLTLADAGRHLFVTADVGVYLFPDWRTAVLR